MKPLYSTLHPLHNNKQGKCLLDICDIYDLDPLIINQQESTCLDVILSNVPAFLKDSGVIDTGLSDYRRSLHNTNLIYTTLNTKLLRPRSECIFERSMKNFNQAAFLDDLSNYKVIGLVSMDPSKAVDTVPHDLITSKLKMYVADDKTVELIKDYLSNRRQRVRIGSNLST